MAGETPPAKPARGPLSFTCPNCGAGVLIRAQGSTLSVVCGSCGSVIDAQSAGSAGENYKVIDQVNQKLKVEPAIPLGTRGKVRGTLWEAIGYMQRADGTRTYKWSEYLLYNPMHGYRWLTEYDGHWNWVSTIKEKPQIRAGMRNRKIASLQQSGKTQHYELYQQGPAVVMYVVGEFFWRVSVDEKVETQDFIAPPQMLSCEKSIDETVWSLGEYLPVAELKAAFPDAKLPIQKGVAPNQPSPSQGASKQVGRYWRRLCVALIAIQVVTMVMARRERVYRGEFSSVAVPKPTPTPTEVVDAAAMVAAGEAAAAAAAAVAAGTMPSPVPDAASVVSPQFELKHGVKNVELELEAAVQNNWLEIEGELVNDQNGETIEFNQGVEYYSGFDSDGSWTEGEQKNRQTLPAVPSGLYHLNLKASGAQLPYTLTLKRDVPIWANFFWSMMLLVLYPVLVYWRSRSFEIARWSNSDYSPYATGSDGDDD